MTIFHVRYWFESNGPDRTGEQVIEAMEAESAAQAAQSVQERMTRERLFTVTPAVGRGSDGSRVVLIQSDHVRYVEFVPAPSSPNGVRA
jgi:hypothetical protein